MQINKSYKIGFLTICCMVIFYYGLWFLKGRNVFSKYNVYQVSYPVNRNLPVSAPVKLKGHVVGMITKIEILPNANYSTLVTIEVDKQFSLTDKSKVMLNSAGVMEGNILEIELYDGRPLTRKDIIVGELHPDFSDSVDLKAMTTQISIITNNLIKTSESVNIILETIHKTTHSLANTINVLENDLTIITKNVIHISTPLADSSKGIPSLLPPMHRILSEIEAMPIKDVSCRMVRVLSDMENLLRDISHNNGTLGLLMHDQELYKNLNSSAKNLNTLLFDLRKNPSRYMHFSLFGAHKNKPKNLEKH